jgi:hypothetical protein
VSSKRLAPPAAGNDDHRASLPADRTEMCTFGEYEDYAAPAGETRFGFGTLWGPGRKADRTRTRTRTHRRVTQPSSVTLPATCADQESLTGKPNGTRKLAESSAPHFGWWIALRSWPGFQVEMLGNALSRLERRAGSGVDLEIGRWLLAGWLAAMAP